MALNLLSTSKKLIAVFNFIDYNLTFSIKQFMGREGKPINYYSVNKAVWNDDRHRYDSVELYSSASLLRIVMYLRDMWYKEIGRELPTDQPIWNKVREQLEKKNNG